MPYILEQNEICFLQIINSQIDIMYEGDVANELREILFHVLSTGEIQQNEVKRVLELLPKVKYLKVVEIREDEDEAFLQEWPEWNGSLENRRKKELMEFQHRLSNWLFVQYVINQKQLMRKQVLVSRRNINSICDNIIIH